MLDLESFAYSAPFGIGPVAEYVRTGQVGIDPIGYATWGVLGAGMEFAVLGTTKFAVYAPVASSSLFGELGLFTVLGLTTPLQVAASVTVGVAVSAAVAKVVVDLTESSGGKPHFTSFTGQMSGRYFDY